MQSTKVKMAVAVVTVMVVGGSITFKVVPRAEALKPTEAPTKVTVTIKESQPQVTEIAETEEVAEQGVTEELPQDTTDVQPEVVAKSAEQLKLESIAEMIKTYKVEPGSSGVKLSDETALAYADAFINASNKYGVDLYTAIGMGWSESGFKWNEVSRCGAVGIMQVMPSTAVDYGVSRDELFDPITNIMTGVHVLADLHYKYKADWATAIRAYNQGLNNAVKSVNRGGDYLRTVQKHSSIMRDTIEN